MLSCCKSRFVTVIEAPFIESELRTRCRCGKKMERKTEIRGGRRCNIFKELDDVLRLVPH